MVALSDKREYQNQYRGAESEISILIDPNLLKAAKRIYRTYRAVNSKMPKTPVGVAINRENHRGQLIFNSQPILLPGESFVPLKQIESETINL